MVRIERESVNFKLPKPLLEALRKAASDRNTTATDLVTQGLHQILGQVPGTENSIENRLCQLETQLERQVKSTENRADNGTDNLIQELRSQLLSQGDRITQLESAIVKVVALVNTQGQRRTSSSRSSYPQYNPQPPQILPFEEENLVRRLNTDIKTLRNNRETMSKAEFIRWCKVVIVLIMGGSIAKKMGCITR
jgi:uncharacterized protein YdcH (DUF465 family)